ncbi:hypothetical protein IWX50DRAFT_629575 [Phyllosticta citricarpa]|uniref:Uncharacterized protein n=1 Tax=Phyllosticta citricarpa TaxID=55181 RepID=A0ABR1MPP2_9PEZI
MWHGCGQRPRYLSIPSRPSHHGKVIIQTTQHNTTPITAAAIVCNSLTFLFFFSYLFFQLGFENASTGLHSHDMPYNAITSIASLASIALHHVMTLACPTSSSFSCHRLCHQLGGKKEEIYHWM